MYKKKIFLFFFLVFSVFFVGNIKVNAATYRYCEYYLPANTTVYESDTKSKELGEEHVLRFIYKDDNLVSFSTGSGKTADYNLFQVYKDGATFKENGDDIANSRDAIVLKNFGFIGKMRTTVCPDSLTSKGIVRDDGILDKYSAGSYKYSKRTDEVYSTSNLSSSLSCTYKMYEPGGSASVLPRFITRDFEGNDHIEYDNIIVNFSLDDIMNPTAIYEENGALEKGFYEIISDPSSNSKDKRKFHSVSDYLNLFNAFKNQQCLEWIVYNPNDGYYLSIEKPATRGWFEDFFIGSDPDYSIFRIDYTKKCNVIKTGLNEINDKLDSLEAEIDKYASNKNITLQISENYLTQYKKIIDDAGNVSGFDTSVCSQEIIDDINNQKNQIAKRVSEYIGDKNKGITGKLHNIVKESTVMTEEEKEQAVFKVDEVAEKYNQIISSITINDINNTQTCTTIFGDFNNPNSLGYMIQTIFDMIKIIAPILVIILGSLDFGRAVLASDQDALKKATSRFVKRCIAAIALFFLPMLINELLKLINSNIDPTCGLK